MLISYSSHDPTRPCRRPWPAKPAYIFYMLPFHTSLHRDTGGIWHPFGGGHCPVWLCRIRCLWKPNGLFSTKWPNEMGEHPYGLRGGPQDFKTDLSTVSLNENPKESRAYPVWLCDTFPQIQGLVIYVCYVCWFQSPNIVGSKNRSAQIQGFQSHQCHLRKWW